MGDGIWIRGAVGCGFCGGFDLDFDVDYLLYCSMYILSEG